MIPGSNESYLTAEQIETCKNADSKVRLVYESGFGNWETLRWGLWGDVMFNNVPVATALATHKPIFENEITNTLNAVSADDVTPFEPVPMDKFENGSLDGSVLTVKGLKKTSRRSRLKGSRSIEWKRLC